TPQRISYLDCTWFCHSVYNSAFNYTIKESISTKVIDTTDGEVYRRTSERIKADPEEARKEFLETIQPGDMIMYSDREAGVSHGMLYIGNGMTIHCSSGSRKAGGKADYNKTAKIDCKEPMGGVLYSELGVVCDDTSSEYYCFKGNKDLLLLRPLASGVKPTADAVARAKNLKGVICWKESTRTGGATVNPGEDVTFTYFIRNDTMKDKQISVTDKLPANTTFKSGDVKFTNGELNTTVTVPARSLVSLSFTVTVSPSAPYGKIPCGDTAIGGVKLYDYAPIVVAKTLTAAEQAKIAAANVTAATDSELIAKTYAEIGKTVNLPSGADLLNRFMSVSAKSVSFTLSSKDFKLVPQGLYGGRYYPGTEFERIRHIGVENAMCGDVLIVLRDPSKLNEVQCYLCVGDGKFKTTENGAVKDVPSVAAASLFDSLIGEHAFLIIRPSFGF
ncbi:MAG: C40 family peptidase, partial [Clostridia bacterium]|nr:C40 family peptidase [Clostridia bacterium]